MYGHLFETHRTKRLFPHTHGRFCWCPSLVHTGTWDRNTTNLDSHAVRYSNVCCVVDVFVGKGTQIEYGIPQGIGTFNCVPSELGTTFGMQEVHFGSHSICCFKPSSCVIVLMCSFNENMVHTFPYQYHAHAFVFRYCITWITNSWYVFLSTECGSIRRRIHK